MRDDLANPIEPLVDTLEQSQAAVNSDNGAPLMPLSAVSLRLIWDKRQMLLRWMIVGLALSTLIAFLIPKRFQSKARLMPPDQSNSGLALLAAASTGRSGSGSTDLGSGLGSGLGSIAGNMLGMKSSGQLFVGILQSRTVQDDLINKFDLRSVYWDRYMEDAREDLNDKTDVSEDRKSGILTICVTDRSPQRAAALAQEYVSELNRVVILSNTSSAHREREFLEERLKQVKQDLESAEDAFSEFASKNTALDIPAQGKAMIEASAALEGQLIGAQTELETLKQVYADGNVRVRATQAKVDELRHQLEKIGGKFDSQIQPGSQNDQSMYPSIKKLPLLGVRYADLYRNSKVEEAIFETLTGEYEVAKVQEAKETPSVKILDSPNVPEKKSYPPRLLIVIIGTMLVMLTGTVCVFANAFWAEIDPQDAHKILALEITEATRARLPWGFANRSSNGGSNGRFWKRSHERRSDVDNPD